MKTGIHPTYELATVTCACGNTFETRSTRREIRTDICGVCHPFYTGEQRIVDTAGQVERFMKRLEASQTAERRTSKRQERLQVRTSAAQEAQAREREAARAEAAAAGRARAAARAEANAAQAQATGADAPEAEATADATPETANTEA